MIVLYDFIRIDSSNKAIKNENKNYLKNRCFISRMPVTMNPMINIIIQSEKDKEHTLKKSFKKGISTIAICPKVTTAAIVKKPLHPLRFHPDPPVL